MWSRVKSFFAWFISDGSAGLGQLLVGIAALYTLIQTVGILEDIHVIKEDARQIRKQMENVKTAVNSLPVPNIKSFHI